MLPTGLNRSPDRVESKNMMKQKRKWSLSRCPGLFGVAFLFVGLIPGKLPAQNEAIISQIVDQFSAIEDLLPQMQSIQVDGDHTESNYGVGKVTIWLDQQTGYAKSKNELQAGNSTEVQEMWMLGNDILFVFERSEWRSDDGSVDVNEMRYYMHQGRVIREMTRRATFQRGQDLDISKVPHETVNDFELDYATAIYEGQQEKGMSIARVAKALGQRPPNAPSLLSLPFRMFVDTLSPDGQYAVAFTIDGVARPDWIQWEKDQFAYLEALGNPQVRTQLVSVWTGAVIGDLQGQFDADWRMGMWAKWSPDGYSFVYGEDARWNTLYAGLYQVRGNTLSKVADVTQGLSKVAIEALKKVKHPYAIDTDEAHGFLNVRALSNQGRLEVEYRIESKFEGDRNNAYIDIIVDYNYGNGQPTVVAANLPEYVPVAATWQELLNKISGEAMAWLSGPPALEDYLQTDTVCENSGMVHLFNQFGKVLNPTAVEMIVGRPLYVSGPHFRGEINRFSQNEFGHYDPISIAMVNDAVSDALKTPALVQATQVLYNAKFRSTIYDYQEALRYWESNPAELERQKQGYLQRIANNTLPEGGYYLLENNLAEQLMNDYSTDYERQLGLLSALRFWLRRSCDGSYGEFANMTQKVIQTYDRVYFSSKGLPDLLIDTEGEETEDGIVEVVMDEDGPLGLNEKTPLNLASLQRQLSGFKVEPATISEEGEDYPIFKVMLGGEVVLAVSDFGTGDPQAFEARSPNIQMKSGISTGDTFERVFGRQYPLGLFVGLETDAGAVIADAPGSEHIRLFFRPDNPDTFQLSDPANPPIEELSNLVLVEMRWQP